jgi:DNA-binding CsgD family transcriptional regulator
MEYDIEVRVRTKMGAMGSNQTVMHRLEQERHAEVASKRQRMKLIIVDENCNVVLDSIDPSEHELRLLLSDNRTTFRGQGEAVVKSLVDYCIAQNERHSRVAFLDAQRLVRVTRLDGRENRLFAVSVEFFRGGDSLSRAARKYRLTPREIDVLGMILEGANAPETAQALQIAETTVQGYYKRLLSKTQSRNRPAMVANVLDWNGTSRRRTAN